LAIKLKCGQVLYGLTFLEGQLQPCGGKGKRRFGLSTGRWGYPHTFPSYPQFEWGNLFFHLWGCALNRKRGSFSPGRHQRQTLFRLILGGLAILLVVGGGLVWAVYGRTAAVTAVACLLAGFGLLALLWLILSLIELWVKEDNS
jgi:hypothetical protein